MHNAIKSLVLIAIVSLLAIPTAQAGLTDDLVLYSSMDTIDVGNSLVPNDLDPSNTYFPGTLNGVTTAPVTDATRGLVLDLGGSDNEYVDYGTDLDPGTDSCSVSIWVNSATLTGTQFIAGKGNAGSGDAGWSIWLDGTGNLVFRVNNTTASVTERYGRTVDFSAGTWHHVAMVLDQTAGTLTGYLDGVAANPIDFTPGDDFSCSQEFLLGRRYTTGAPLGGMVDDLAVWGRALSSTEIANIAAGTPIVDVPEPGTIALLIGMLAAGMFVWRKR